VTWAHDHPGAPCPTADDLDAPLDPWGHAMRVTCKGQPGNQIVGVISAGPDGQPDNDDDVASWMLPAEITNLVRGKRWAATPGAPPAVTPTTPRSAPH
jgi:hypothetical protein